tara:strand:- start:1243 stop:2598 length:1356 start_codon:yes stop_codon:yes gene_type:complete
MTLIKSISGIRGIINVSINSILVAKYVKAFSKISPNSTILLARDTRNSGDKFIEDSIHVLKNLGKKYINCGIIPTPTAQYLIKKNNYAGGIVFTASHNPEDWNGMKFIDSNGIFLDHQKFNDLENEAEKTTINTLEDYTLQSENDKDLSGKSITTHIKDILSLSINNSSLVENKKFKVAIDCTNGATSKALPELLNKFNCEIFSINSTYSELFPRSPEPIPSNLKELSQFVIDNNADLGLATDPDGDRLSIIDNKGNPLGEELTLSLSVYYFLKYFPINRKYPIVTNLSTSLLPEKISESFDTPFIRTPVGEINVVKTMQKENSLIGGEGNGGIILKESHLGRDSLVGAMIILNLLANEDKSLNEIYNSFPKYYIQKSSLKLDDSSNSAISKIKQKFNKQNMIDIDGLKIIWEDEWVHIRKSNTEPILRIIAESKSNKRSSELIQTIKNII